MAGDFSGPFFQWTISDEPFKLELADEEYWDRLRSRYDPTGASPPLARLIEIMKVHGAATVLTEYRYIDSDFRSEHAAFYSSTFVRYPSVCHRLHFFDAPVEDLEDLPKLPEAAYLGYSIMRPLEERPVGRTLVRPPTEGSYCWAEESVHLIGHNFIVRGMPYISQDAQYTRCAHSTVWMVLRHASLTADLPRRTPSDVHLATSGGRVLGRDTPSDGLSTEQVLSGLHKLGSSAASFDLTEDGGGRLIPERESTRSRRRRERSERDGLEKRLRTLLIPYINSQIPPLVYSSRHIWVVAGYRKKISATGSSSISYIIHDDSEGPYLEVDPTMDRNERSPWMAAIPPLPKKLYLTAERAEVVADDVFRGSEERAATSALDAVLPSGEEAEQDAEAQFLRRLVDRVRDAGPDVDPDDLAIVEATAEIVLANLSDDSEMFDTLRGSGQGVGLFIGHVEALSRLRQSGTDVSYRTYAIDSQRFKAGTRGRLPNDTARAYRYLNLPRYVWVVELVDSRLRSRGELDVIGEVVLDGTAHQKASPESHTSLLAVHVWGVCTTHTVDHQALRTTVARIDTPYQSGCADNRFPQLAEGTA